ncbi:MAG: exonuclease domain-containing protein [Phyllobacterium sp.]|uniref:exonuclease domain-containing protein n=1 Tax=Phyllobacterium sp. TaxID=1871046 RepID=UPI0030F01AD3
MKSDRRLVLVMLAPGAALAAWLLLGGAVIWMTLAPLERAGVDAVIGPLLSSHGVLPVAWWLVAAALMAWAACRLYEAHVAETARLADATKVLIGDVTAPDLVPRGGAVARDLTVAINDLAAARRALQEEMACLAAQTSRAVAEQRDQLGALMADLNQCVVVCNLEGRILLYNKRARQLFCGPSPTFQGAGGSELIGLGRSIHGVFDPLLIAHALETVERRLARGDEAAAVSARFVTGTPAGHLLRVSLAPVCHATSDKPALTGFMLLLDDITEEYEAHTRHDRQLLEFTDASRASFASMQVALDILGHPNLEAEKRDHLRKIVQDEVSAMSVRLAALAAETSHDHLTRWPLQEMLGADLVAAAVTRIAAVTGQQVERNGVEGNLWLYVDSFAIIQVLTFLARRLTKAIDRPNLGIRLTRAGDRAHLDLIWPSEDASAEIFDWQTVEMQVDDALSVRDVAKRHGGEAWLEHDRKHRLSFFRFLLPLATDEPAAAVTREGSRPEYYDFDLFTASENNHALDERLLENITYTVFDTETTGLYPAHGDEIIQIGATRIVNGKLLSGECFDQLVDPQRIIPEASIPIHGIRQAMVRGKPSIAEVLPAFRAFAIDTVLVGHNVAFDMRFIKLKESVSGVRFDQPVLDTMLLSSLVHPHEESHDLDSIGARLGVTISDRHTALGDALTTAKVFLKMIPLLRGRGILTLGQAREAEQNSYYSRLRY